IETLLFLTGQQAVDRALAGVIRSEREPPVFEMGVEIAQVFGGGASAGFGFQALIKGADTQAEAFGGGGHQLKQAGSALRAAGARVERGLYFGDPNELR